MISSVVLFEFLFESNADCSSLSSKESRCLGALLLRVTCLSRKEPSDCHLKTSEAIDSVKLLEIQCILMNSLTVSYQ